MQKKNEKEKLVFLFSFELKWNWIYIASSRNMHLPAPKDQYFAKRKIIGKRILYNIHSNMILDVNESIAFCLMNKNKAKKKFSTSYLCQCNISNQKIRFILFAQNVRISM